MGTKPFTTAGLSALALMATLGAVQAEGLVVSNWDGYMAADAIDSYTAATGNAAELVLHGKIGRASCRERVSPYV